MTKDETCKLAFHFMSCEVIDAGWRDENMTFGDYVALLHSEVSEILEAFRDYGTTRTYHNNKPVDVGSEMADVLIRLIDFADICGVNLVDEFYRKMEYNRTRGPQWNQRTITRGW